MKVTVGRNKYCLWMKRGKTRTVLEWRKTRSSHAKKMLMKLLSFYLDLNIGRGRRVSAELPDELLEKAVDLCKIIEKYELYCLRNFRDELNTAMNADSSEALVRQVEEVVKKYAVVRVLRKIGDYESPASSRL